MSLPSCAIIMFYVNWNNESMQKSIWNTFRYSKSCHKYIYTELSVEQVYAHTLLVAVLEYVLMHERTTFTFFQ